MKRTRQLYSLRDVLSPATQKPIRIPTSKFDDLVRSPKIQSLALKEAQRKLYDMGELIHDVQMSRQYPRCKTFLDLKMKLPFNEVMKNYRHLKLTFGPGKIPPPFLILKFLKDNFEEADDLQEWTPEDWKEDPSLINKTSDFKEFAFKANEMVKCLGRKVSENVKKNKDIYSLVYVNNGFISSSTELKETYYWDSYWIVRGLLVNDMEATAKGMIENFIQLLDLYNYVPISNRIYYVNQSQIPTLILMVDAYYQRTKDIKFIKDNIKILEKEMIFWKNKRSLTIKSKNSDYTLYRYTSDITKPRPHHYREDYKYMVTPEDAELILSGLNAAEESCWSPTSRWIDANGSNEGTVYDVRTQNIIPVDLNAVIQKNLKIIAHWYKDIGDDKKSGQYELQAEELLIAINNVMWDETLNMWCDYCYIRNELRRYHYLSNFTPIWTGSHTFHRDKLAKSLLKYISNNNLAYLGGIPVSLEFSGEFWDFPYVHPTVLAIFLEGIDNLQHETLSEVARLLAEMWIDAACLTFEESGQIYNVYNALKPGVIYNKKALKDYCGHGATIGVLFTFFAKWGSALKKSPRQQKVLKNTS